MKLIKGEEIYIEVELRDVSLNLHHISLYVFEWILYNSQLINGF